MVLLSFRCKKIGTQELVLLSMLTALNVIAAELLKLKIIPNVLELSLGFMPIAVAGMLMGHAPAAIMAMLADILGALIFPAGPFFPGFTLTALCTGVIYGVFLYQKPVRIWQILLAQALVSLLCFAGLNTLWTYLMGYGRSREYITTRLLVNLVSYPVYAALLYGLTRYRPVLERAVR